MATNTEKANKFDKIKEEINEEIKRLEEEVLEPFDFIRERHRDWELANARLMKKRFEWQ